MTDKSKIYLIYSVVALVSALIMAVAFYIRGQRVQPGGDAYYSETTEFAPLLTLEKDLTLTRQDGQEVKVSDLKGKVWALAQFYATCPMCAKRNSQGLKAVYEKFKNHPDFKLICMTVNPEEDGVEQMKSYAEALGADASDWWFLTGEADGLKDYMVSEMKFDPVQKRTNPDEIAMKGELMHNMRIVVYNRNLSMVGSRSPYDARKNGDKAYEEELKALNQMIDAVLKQQ